MGEAKRRTVRGEMPQRGGHHMVVTGGRREATNPFGHTAIGVTGAGIYSYGNNTPLGSSPLSYLESQSLLRDQLVTERLRKIGPRIRGRGLN